MALVILAAVSYQCSAAWGWIRAAIIKRETRSASSGVFSTRQTSIRISHSLPDLQSLPTQHQLVQEKECKRVLRQTTLPTVPVRLQTFQRQLSQRFDVPCIQFSICKFEERTDSNLGLIKPELYVSEKERTNSVDSNATADLEYCGKLHLALRYDSEIEGLVVKVLEARDLPIKDVTGSSDPYVKVYLLPDRKKKFQTKVHRKNLNPVFNETFIFSVSYDDLQKRYLQFSVYDFDRFSRHDLIGQVVLKGLLDASDLHQEIEYTMNILSSPMEKKRLGELMLSLCYLPRAGRLTLTVIKARNLKAKDIINGKSDPYVKVYLMCEGKRIKKKKTTVKKSTLFPIYNEALMFDVPAENVEDVSLIVNVVDHDIIGVNELLGCIGIGNNFIGIGRDHWLEMLDNPRKPVAQWYPLLESLPGQASYVSRNHHPIKNLLNI
ncbi:synaptotagmin-10, putative [Pediculus humanus corporis]|uniref:Synaptotagmin-10, putative n=1 Tax=Pediculus humanus subsp. corporis TaxID=121224 RepID=E0W2A7_PEDHC|nr:synaptotagmin-10, putative [Pediculus humanus corporis]EEB19763.1 synaptotagmin-10, putative [Pediculus humanus corporis]